MFSLSGEKSFFIDSISADNYTYKFNFGTNHSGFYRLIFNNKKWLDFIYDGEDIEIEVDASSKNAPPKIINSDENKIYYDFIELNKDYKTKSELLFLILNNYPDNDNYYQTTKETLAKLQEEYLYFVNITAQSKPSSFISKYVLSAQLPIIDADLRGKDQLNYLKLFALDKVDFTKDELIYSDVFTNKTIEYLSYYSNPQLPMELLEKGFQTAVDTILHKAKVNDIVYKHITEYLLDGFKKFGFDNVINYIIENYVVKDDICLDEKLETALERRIQQSKNFKTGHIVPNILLPDSSGSLVDLSKIKSEKTLIIFYASWCPHCKKMLPEIYELYKNQEVKKVEVFAVSIDTLKTDWLSFVESNKLNWINVCDLQGWDGNTAIDYYLYATPTMFMLDGQKKIISPPVSVQELKSIF
ncbi:MAG: TlpA family protein disulfide reductase [Ignavibacteriales bacterium]|nr:TlpA family protein disulfide reductase [Ignavibacteriales bacterium]